jgi:hypothetical protein
MFDHYASTSCIFAGAVILPLIVFAVPESHPYWTLARLQRRNPACADGVKEAAAIRACVPRFEAPWYPYQILLDRCACCCSHFFDALADYVRACCMWILSQHYMLACCLLRSMPDRTSSIS